MRKTNMLIIPAGSGTAVAAIKALRQEKNITVISADTNMLAPGLYLSDKGYLVPPFGDELFYPKVKRIVEKEQIDVILPALDTLLLPFSKKAGEFEELGSKVLVSEPETIKITGDKWKTYLQFKDALAMPRSFIKKTDVDVPYPLLIKPRGGSGSHQVYMIHSDSELDFFYGYVTQPIIQEYIDGREYTTDCLADMDGNLVFSSPRERLEMRDGISVKGRVIKDKRLEEMTKKIARKLKLKGPFFWQAIAGQDGIPKLIEINARIAGTMCLSSFSRANIYTLAVQLCIGEKIVVPERKYGTYVTRYWEEIYLTDEEIEDKTSKI